MNPSNLKFSSIVPKCLKPEDPEAEIFLRNQDLIAAIENFMSQGTKICKVMLLASEVDELIQNLVVRLKESENWKEVTFWRSQIVRLWDQSDKLYTVYQLWDDRPGSEAEASKMVVGLDCEGFEKVKGDANVDEYRDKMKETDDSISLTDDENKIDVKPDVNEALAKKEDYEDIEKVIPKEIEDIRLFKYDDKLDDPLNDESLVRKEDYEVVEKVKDDLEKFKFSEIKENDENYDKPIEIPDYEPKDEETLVIPQEISPMDSASSGIFFPEGCG